MKTALVTGGSRGIGKAIVRQLRQEGYQVAFGYKDAMDQAKALSEETGAFAIRADLGDETQALAFVETTISRLRHLDAVVLNAGISHFSLTQDLRYADWKKVMDSNLTGAFLVSREAIKAMIPRQEGSLLFISSMWGLRGAACEAAYAASKGGMIAFAASLAQELGTSGIRVNCLAPGLIDTDMNKGFTAEEMDTLIGRIPLGRIGRPEDIAKAATFLISDRAGYITGQVLGVDGGFV